jgi:flagellar motor switch protein FliN/FliY
MDGAGAAACVFCAFAKEGEAMSDQPILTSSNSVAAASAARARRAIAGGGTPVFKSLSADKTPSLDDLKEIEVDVRIELGRARMRIEEVLKLGQGAVIELDRSADEPVEIYANDRLIARGEVVVLDDQLAVRITEVISTEGRD